MTLPQSDVPWPPPEVRTAYEQHRVDDAWYTGDVNKLTTLYATPGQQGGSTLWAGLKRWFWGTPTPGTAGQAPNKVHLPVPTEVARMSAAVLFGEMFTAEFQHDLGTDRDADGQPDEQVDPHEARNARLNELLGDDAHSRLLEAGEYASAHGGAYLKVTWDTAVSPDGPFLTVATSDTAVPEFRYGRLTAVTFWATLDAQGGMYYTLLERHAPGTVEYALYESATARRIGIRVPLTSHPAATVLAGLVNEQSQIATGSTLLTAQYLPNVRPNSLHRTDPLARNLGRSDYTGAYDLFDAADETLTSLQRDVRLAKARLIVPSGMLQLGTPGQGGSFNADQELIVESGSMVGSYNPAATSGGTDSAKLDLFQPAIRDQEHQRILDSHRAAIYQACGFSPQSFGDGGDIAITATEVTSREKLTILTRSAKVLTARPVLQLLLAALLDVDEEYFRGPGRAGLLPSIEWPDAAADSPKVIAETLQALNLSESTSIRTRVQMLHPDWADPEIDDEVDRIREDISTSPLGSEKDLWAAAGGTTMPTTAADEPQQVNAADDGTAPA